MAKQQTTRTWDMRQGRYTAVWGAYLLLCGSIVLAGALVGVTGFASSPVDTQTVQPKATEIPVARIQLLPDRNNLCRAIIFHNDSGHYQEGGTGQCIIPQDMLVWTVHRRAEAFADAFRSSWKGEPVASTQ